MSKQQEAMNAPPPAKKSRYQQGQVKSTEELYLTSKFPDVHFSFASNDGQIVRVPAHKNLLAVISDVFEKMFYGGLKEKDDVTITDASAAAFKEFLQFFYLSDVKLSTEHIPEVMYLGNKYNVKKCFAGCIEILKTELTIESVCTTLSLAILYDQEELMEPCEMRILLNTAEVFASNGFLECGKEVLAHILRMNLLSCSEVDVFEACMAWVRAKSKQRVLSKAMVKKHLGDSYYDIRFASMTNREFCALEEKYNAVLSSDFKTIIQFIAQPEKESEQFNTCPRQIKWNEGQSISFERDIYSPLQWYVLDIEEKTIFSTNQPLLLGGFRCNIIRFCKEDLKDLRSNLSTQVEITEARSLDGADLKVLSNMTTNLGSRPIVSLTQPILIRPRFFYTICIKKFPDGHYFESNEEMRYVKHHSGINVEFHNHKIVNGHIVGLIYKLFFNKITQSNIID